MTIAIPLLTLEARIKRALRAHLRQLGFTRSTNGSLEPPTQEKDVLRRMHATQRLLVLKREAEFVGSYWDALKRHFADGNDVVPSQIRPRLERVFSKTWQSELFRLATLMWSIPVSRGYGRRLRFLVWDEANDALIGLIALGDPVFNLKVRDEWVGWTAEERKQRLIHLLDAYVLGAVPPYNQLLGGKLVAALIRTREVEHAFAASYHKRVGIISGKAKHASLAAITTSSAFGRSSVYNRLVLSDNLKFHSLGYTSGFGHFHVPDELFLLMRQYLLRKRHKYADNFEFGAGPNWKMRAVRETLRSLGMNPGLLRHGVRREVFVCPLAANALSVLRGQTSRADYSTLEPAAAVADKAVHRWVIPRSERDQSYKAWRKTSMLAKLTQPSSAVDALTLQHHGAR